MLRTGCCRNALVAYLLQAGEKRPVRLDLALLFGFEILGFLDELPMLLLFFLIFILLRLPRPLFLIELGLPTAFRSVRVT